jgi:hypothetical protein
VRKFEEELEKKGNIPKIHPKLNQFNRDQKKWEEDRLMASVRFSLFHFTYGQRIFFFCL